MDLSPVKKEGISLLKKELNYKDIQQKYNK